MLADELIRIPLTDGESVTGAWTRPESGATSAWRFIYAPGAGSNLNDRFGLFAAQKLGEQGITTLRFQFPYSERGRRLPDRPPVLEAAWEAAIRCAAEVGSRLAIGGRSMGGRIASQVAATGAAVDALVLFAYPLHPPGRPQRPRDGHLFGVTCPTLFVSGTHDAFGTPVELTAAAALVPRSKLHLLDEADHAFAVPKRSGKTQEELWTEAVQSFLRFLTSI